MKYKNEIGHLFNKYRSHLNFPFYDKLFTKLKILHFLLVLMFYKH